MSEEYPKQALMSAEPHVLEAVEALHEVFDPEAGINIVDLGLVYGIERSGAQIDVRMTLTSPGCPAGEYIMEGVRSRLGRLPDVEEVEVELVWDPPWSPEAISPEGRAELGWR